MANLCRWRHENVIGSSCPCPTSLSDFNPLNAELNHICHLLALLGAHHILHVGRIRVKCEDVNWFRGTWVTNQWRFVVNGTVVDNLLTAPGTVWFAVWTFRG